MPTYFLVPARDEKGRRHTEHSLTIDEVREHIHLSGGQFDNLPPIIEKIVLPLRKAVGDKTQYLCMTLHQTDITGIVACAVVTDKTRVYEVSEEIQISLESDIVSLSMYERAFECIGLRYVKCANANSRAQIYLKSLSNDWPSTTELMNQAVANIESEHYQKVNELKAETNDILAQTLPLLQRIRNSVSRTVASSDELKTILCDAPDRLEEVFFPHCVSSLIDR